MKTVSIDLGYGHIKVYDGKKLLKFPTQIERLGVVKNGFEDSENTYIFNGEKYIVGETATNSFITRNFQFLIDYSPLLIYVALQKMNINVNEIEKLNLGLSLVNLTNLINKELYVKSISKEHLINGVPLKLQNIKLNVQGVGIYNVFKNTIKDDFENVFVIDVGYNTLDCLNFISNKPNSKGSFANEKGVNLIIKDLQTLLENKFNTSNFSEQKINNILEKKFLKFDGVNYDLTKEISEIVNSYVKDLMYEIKIKSKDNFNFSDYIVFGGGGAYLIKEYLTETQANYVFLERPEFANVIGY